MSEQWWNEKSIGLVKIQYPLEIFLSFFGGFDEKESGDFDLIDRGDRSGIKSASLSSKTSKPQ